MNSHEAFIHIHQGCFAGTGAIVRLPQCQWSKPDGCRQISQCITTTKHSKAKTVCIFLGIYCRNRLTLQDQAFVRCCWRLTVHSDICDLVILSVSWERHLSSSVPVWYMSYQSVYKMSSVIISIQIVRLFWNTYSHSFHLNITCVHDYMKYDRQILNQLLWLPIFSVIEIVICFNW